MINTEIDHTVIPANNGKNSINILYKIQEIRKNLNTLYKADNKNVKSKEQKKKQ